MSGRTRDTGHCCEMMANFADNTCDMHESRFDCADALIHRGQSQYGIIVHDGGESWIAINFCPWCGNKLPEATDA